MAALATALPAPQGSVSSARIVAKAGLHLSSIVMPLTAILKTPDVNNPIRSSPAWPIRLTAALVLILTAGCGTSGPAVPDVSSAPEAEGVQTAGTEAASFPDGILHFGGFEPGTPRQCAYLDHPRSDLGADAEAWLVERQIMADGFPINLYGESTPKWAEGRTVYVYCEEE